jgi:hypothetical protein
MNVIEEVKTRLSKYPDTRYSETPESIEIHPANDSGFSVGLMVSGGRYTVWFEGWHEEFESSAEALNCFAFGLSEACRLAVTYRGETAVKWVVESRRDGTWVADSEVGLLVAPFWRRATVTRKQNHLISLSDAD